jgi:hypothetical protein
MSRLKVVCETRWCILTYQAGIYCLKSSAEVTRTSNHLIMQVSENASRYDRLNRVALVTNPMSTWVQWVEYLGKASPKT